MLCVVAVSMLPSHRVTVASLSDIRLESGPAGAPARIKARYGLASYYARSFDGQVTASGRRFDNDALVAAHPTYPFGTVVRVTNLTNGRTVDVRIVDRGPALGPRTGGVIIDLSQAAAERLGFVRAGRARVRVEVLRPAGDV